MLSLATSSKILANVCAISLRHNSDASSTPKSTGRVNVARTTWKLVVGLIIRKVTRGGNKGEAKSGEEIREEETETRKLAQKLLKEGGIVDIRGVPRSHVEYIVRHVRQ